MEKKFNLIYISLFALVLIVLVQSYYLYDFKKELQTNDVKIKSTKVVPVDSFTNQFFNNGNSNSGDLFEQMQKMQEQMQKSFGQFNSIFSKDPFFKDAFSHMSTSPLSDFKENKDEYILELNIPGAKENKIVINTQGNSLKIDATINNSKDTNGTNYFHKERYTQHFSRSFVLPDDAKTSSFESKYENGILRISIPKKK